MHVMLSPLNTQVCVIVDEEGTEAAAVTAVVMMRCAAVMTAEPVVIKLDRCATLCSDHTAMPMLGTHAAGHEHGRVRAWTHAQQLTPQARAVCLHVLRSGRSCSCWLTTPPTRRCLSAQSPTQASDTGCPGRCAGCIVRATARCGLHPPRHWRQHASQCNPPAR
jgi:hypothetical protein